MAYILLGVAIAFELIATVCLKYSNGFTNLLPSIGSVIAYIICFYTFSKSLTNINLSVAYATWSAVGIIVSSLLSVFLFKEGITKIGVVGILFIVVGVILLNMLGSAK